MICKCGEALTTLFVLSCCKVVAWTVETLSTQEPHWGSQMIGTLRAGGARGLWKTPKHTHYTHECERGCRHQGGARHEGECEGEAAGKRLGLRKVSLNVLRRVRTQPKPKNQLKQPLTLNTLSKLTPTRCTSLSLYSRGVSNALFKRCCKKVSTGDDFWEPC